MIDPIDLQSLSNSSVIEFSVLLINDVIFILFYK